MKYIELAFVVVCVVAILQALGRRLPVPMALLQIAAGVALTSVAALDDLREQSALLFVMLVPPLLYIEAWQVPKRELLRSIGPVLGLAIGLVAVTIAVVGFGVHALLPEMPLAVAFALAAALATTDTVAVSNFVGRLPLPPQLRVLAQRRKPAQRLGGAGGVQDRGGRRGHLALLRRRGQPVAVDRLGRRPGHRRGRRAGGPRAAPRV